LVDLADKGGDMSRAARFLHEVRHAEATGAAHRCSAVSVAFFETAGDPDAVAAERWSAGAGYRRGLRSNAYGKIPEPWVGGNRYVFARLRCDDVSGRRVISHGR
jgi:hypothetical protein